MVSIITIATCCCLQQAGWKAGIVSITRAHYNSSRAGLDRRSQATGRCMFDRTLISRQPICVRCLIAEPPSNGHIIDGECLDTGRIEPTANASNRPTSANRLERMNDRFDRTIRHLNVHEISVQAGLAAIRYTYPRHPAALPCEYSVSTRSSRREPPANMPLRSYLFAFCPPGSSRWRVRRSLTSASWYCPT